MRKKLLLSIWLCGAITFGLMLEVNSFQHQDEGQSDQLRRPVAETGEGEGPERLGWFYGQRAYPGEDIPPAARATAIQEWQAEEERLRERNAFAPGSFVEPEQQPAWTPLGPQPISGGQTFGSPRGQVAGRVTTVTLDPGYNGTSNQTVYLGAAQGGLWRSRDNGGSWTPLTDDQPSLAVGAIAVDPTNSNNIYIGTGEGKEPPLCYYGAGLLKSIDGGATWRQIPGPPSTNNPQLPAFLYASFTALAIDPNAPATLYAATSIGQFTTASLNVGQAPRGNRGVWKSTDAGVTWRNLNPANATTEVSGTDVLLDPRDSRRVFAALRGLGIYRSNNGGEPGAWEKLTNGLPAGDFGRIDLAAGPPLAPSSNTTFYAAITTAVKPGELLGIYRSTDGGASWIKGNNPSDPSGLQQALYNLAIAVDPVDANVIYFGASANRSGTDGPVRRSRDGGLTWTGISRGDGLSGGLHSDTHCIVIQPNDRDVLFTGNDGGIWRTANATADTVSWVNLNRTLSITQFMSVALHPLQTTPLIGGTQDNGTNRYDGAAAWFHSDDGDGGFTLIDQADPEAMYHTYFNLNGRTGNATLGTAFSANGGAAWSLRGCFRCSAAIGNIHPSDRVSFYAPMAQVTGTGGANGNPIYYGTHRLYRSANRGVTWDGLGASADGFGADLTKNTPDPDAPFQSGFPSLISAIAAHPQLDRSVTPLGEQVWVGTGDGLIQMTKNARALAGATFTNLTKPPLPNRFVADIALDPNDPQRAVAIYSGFNQNTPDTPGHVFLTTDQGTTWRNISGNLPDVPATTVVIDPLVANAYFIGTDIGVFQTTDGGATWFKLSNGLPNVAVMMLRYHAASRSLVAATHGRGMFRLVLPGDVASVSAAGFGRNRLAPEVIAAAFGARLATTTQVAETQPLPMALAGTRVAVRDSNRVERFAPLFFVSPNQVNYQIPAGTAAGIALVTITSGDGKTVSGLEQIALVAPSLFAANAGGQGVAAANALRVRADGSVIYESLMSYDAAQQRFVPLPVSLGPEGEQVYLILYGTGARFGNAANAFAKVGGVEVAVQFVGAVDGSVGLDQINLGPLPRTLAGRGEMKISLQVDGLAANVVTVAIR